MNAFCASAGPIVVQASCLQGPEYSAYAGWKPALRSLVDIIIFSINT